MLLPNKTISFNESILKLFPLILRSIEENPDIKVLDLYVSIKKDCSSINQFTQSLDCLFALGLIDFSSEEGGLELC